jgi:putative FmdB family regulatory protein
VQFDKTQKFTDQPLTRCPECGKKSLRKVYQPVGIVFKGSGFYSTDNRSPSGGYPTSSKNNEKSSAPSKPAHDSTESSADKSSASEPTKKVETAGKK